MMSSQWIMSTDNSAWAWRQHGFNWKPSLQTREKEF